MNRGHVLHVGTPLLIYFWNGTVVAAGGGSNNFSTPSSWTHLSTLASPSASSSTQSLWPWSIIQWQRSLRSFWVWEIWWVMKTSEHTGEPGESSLILIPVLGELTMYYMQWTGFISVFSWIYGWIDKNILTSMLVYFPLFPSLLLFWLYSLHVLYFTLTLLLSYYQW